MLITPTKNGYTAKITYDNGATLIHGKDRLSVIVSAIESVFENLNDN